MAEGGFFSESLIDWISLSLSQEGRRTDFESRSSEPGSQHGCYIQHKGSSYLNARTKYCTKLVVLQYFPNLRDQGQQHLHVPLLKDNETRKYFSSFSIQSETFLKWMTKGLSLLAPNWLIFCPGSVFCHIDFIMSLIHEQDRLKSSIVVLVVN